MALNHVQQTILSRLDELGIGPVEAVRDVDGLEKNFLRDLVDDRKQSFSSRKSPLVAQALRWTMAELQNALYGAVPDARAARSPRGASKITMVPLLDFVTAGTLASPMSQIPEMDAPKFAFDRLGAGEFFALRVTGTSMNRVSPDGSIIVVNHRDKQLVNGKYYVFSIKGEATYKRWHAEPAYLDPDSTEPEHRPTFITRKKDLGVIGRVKRTIFDL
jgi:SOS-response transcriptional repressor LexA